MTSLIEQLMQRPLVEDPNPLYDELRANDPVHREDNGIWYLTRYQDVSELLLSGSVRMHHGRITPGGSESPRADRLMSLMFVHYDGDKHTEARGTVAPQFTAEASRRWAGRIDELTDSLLDELDPSGPIDLDGALAARLPVLVTCEMLGIPVEDRDDCVGWVDVLTAANQPVLSGSLSRARDEVAGSLRSYFVDLMNRVGRSSDPTTVVEVLSADVVDGTADIEEAAATLVLLMAAGFETTRYTITGGVAALIERPDQWAVARSQVLEKGSISSLAAEEILRHQGPIHGATARVAVEPLVLGGTEIPVGEPIVAIVAAANRDGAVYPDPHSLRLDRRGPKVLGFGAGPHYCLGFSVAKHEIRSAISGVLRRYPELVIAERPGTRGSFNVRGPAGLRVMVA